MAVKLNPDDAKAIDLLLDQSERSRELQSPAFVLPTDSVWSRVGPVRQLLSVLDALTPEEPPADLIQRTLARIARKSVDSSQSASEQNNTSYRLDT